MTIVLAILTSYTGIHLVRNWGMNSLTLVNQRLTDYKSLKKELIVSLAYTLSGLLLIIPGFVTDIIGFLLLSRARKKLIGFFLLLWRCILRYPSAKSHIIDGEYVVRRNKK
jgi:UPF0716 protein FxsA